MAVMQSAHVCPQRHLLTQRVDSTLSLTACAKSSSTESNTMLTMITKLATSPVAAESALATSRMITSGLARSRMN